MRDGFMNPSLLAREAASSLGSLDPKPEPSIVFQGPTRLAHYQTDEGWFYVLPDGTEVGPFESEWHMIKYMEDRDVHVGE